MPSLCILLLPLLVAINPRPAVSISFKEAPVGALPREFSISQTNAGGEPVWEIAEDDTSPDRAHVLAQTSKEETNARFPLCIYEPLSAKNVSVSVRFKTISGTVDRAGGLVLRYQDKDNYYIARANALEDNVRFYKIEQGKRKQLATADAKVAALQWHTLKLTAQDARFEVHFNGRKLFDASDETFKGAGKVGLWTKADSVTYFDDLVITVADESK